MPRYQDVYPESALLRSTDSPRLRALELVTLEYFEAEPGEMPTEVFPQHHILLNLKEESHRVENWRDGEHRDFIYERDEVVITPAGVSSGWRWHEKSKVIVITLDPEPFEKFALDELGVLLTSRQLSDEPQFKDPDLVQAGVQLMEALESDLGSEVLFESFARVFLTKLIRKYGEQRSEEEEAFSAGFTSRHYRRVIDFVAAHFSERIAVEDLAKQAFLSPFHFSRLFKETIGTSPHRFVMDYRIEQAKKRLVTTGDPIGEIAIDCGFSDQAHLGRVFKKAEGKTPRQYRTGHAE